MHEPSRESRNVGQSLAVDAVPRADTAITASSGKRAMAVQGLQPCERKYKPHRHAAPTYTGLNASAFTGYTCSSPSFFSRWHLNAYLVRRQRELAQGHRTRMLCHALLLLDLLGHVEVLHRDTAIDGADCKPCQVKLDDAESIARPCHNEPSKGVCTLPINKRADASCLELER